MRPADLDLPVALLCGLLLGACVPPTAPPDGGDGDGDGGEVIGVGDPATAVLGTDGGEVRATFTSGAEVSLSLPPGALVGDTEITLTPAAPHDDELLRVDVAPGGLVLRAPATLSITLDDDAAVGADTSLAVGAQDDLTPVPTTRSGAVLSAEVFMLGIETEEEIEGALSHATGTGTFAAANYPCSIRAQLLNNKLQELITQPGLFELALQLYQLQLSVLTDDGCASEAQSLPGELAPVICAQYQAAIDSAAQTTPTSPGDFGRTVRPILYWAGEALGFGQTCLDQPGVTTAASEFMTPIAAEATEFLAWYEGQLDGIAADNYELVRQEAYALFDLLPELLALGLDEHAERLETDLLGPVMNRLRASAYATAQSSTYTHPLIVVTEGGFVQPRMIIGDTPEPPGGIIGLPFPFSDSDVHDDIQYALSDLSVSTGGTIHTLGGGSQPGQHTTTASLTVTESSEVTLAGTVRGLTCWNGDALDAGDTLVVRLDGVEVQSLSKATANGNFFTSNVVLDIGTFFAANGIAFENGGTHQLTVERSRPLTGERAVYCPEHVLGPADTTLFTIELTARAPSAFLQTFGELRVEARSYEAVCTSNCDIVNIDSVDIGALDIGPEQLPYSLETLSQTATATSNNDTSTVTVENVSITLTEAGDTAALRVQGELSGVGSGTEEEFRGIGDVDWTIEQLMQPEGQPAFETAAVTGTVDFDVGAIAASNNTADITVNGAFGSQSVLSMSKPLGYDPWTETGTINAMLTEPDPASDRVGLNVRLHIDMGPETGDTFVGSSAVSFDITLTLSR